MNRTFDRYVLLKQFSMGCLGEVYLARRDDANDRRVVKLFNPYLFDEARVDPAWLAQVERDNAPLDDPRIVRIDETGIVEDVAYLAMPYVDGDTLANLAVRSRKAGTHLPPELGLYIAREVAQAIGQAHRAGVVHLDVTPRNVFVTWRGDVRVTDFGVASVKRLSGRASAGTIAGKYAYMAPEQLREAPVGPATDVFSLGVVLHETLTGRPVFQQRNEYDTVRAILECAVPEPSKFDPTLSPSLDALVLGATRRDPAERYADGTAFADALLAELSSRGVPPSAAREGLRASLEELYADYLAGRVSRP